MESNMEQMILNANAEDMDGIMKAVVKRYNQLFPKWEISLITLEKEKDRVAQLDSTIAFLTQMKHLVE